MIMSMLRTVLAFFLLSGGSSPLFSAVSAFSTPSHHNARHSSVDISTRKAATEFSFLLARSSTTTRLYSTVVDKPVVKEKQQEKTRQDQDTRLPPFLVRLWNDPYNKREFVARCLAEVCGKSDGESFQIMMQAHKAGMGLIGQYDLERAELYVSTLRQQGLLVDMVPADEE